MALAVAVERTNLDLHNEMIKRAEDLIPVLKERSESANVDRRIPKETIQDMKDAGFFKILQPKQYGGFELDPHTFSEVQLRISQGCMSTAYNLEDIFATPGIDCFFIGRSDLTVSLGYNDPSHPDVVSAVEAICAKGKEANLRLGTFTANIEERPSWRAQHVSLFILASDHGFMLQGARTFSEKVRAYF